jgi:hypothetical protein
MTAVYLVAFFTISQSAIEGFLTYNLLVEGWGDKEQLGLLRRAYKVMSVLQPVLIAPRERYFIYHCTITTERCHMISCPLCPVLLHLENLDLLYGYLWTEG